MRLTLQISRYFNPRSPHGERRDGARRCRRCSGFQSTLPARGATQPRCVRPAGERISIHAPRTGSDMQPSMLNASLTYFNPRSPHGERRRDALTIFVRSRFQSTLPARGATPPGLRCRRSGGRISIHAPRTGSDSGGVMLLSDVAISIHAPRTGSDRLRTWRWNIGRNFNPRSPHGERPRPSGGSACRSGFQSTLPARGATPTSACGN